MQRREESPWGNIGSLFTVFGKHNRLFRLAEAPFLVVINTGNEWKICKESLYLYANQKGNDYEVPHRNTEF